jgi:hypothetical protein
MGLRVPFALVPFGNLVSLSNKVYNIQYISSFEDKLFSNIYI